MDQRRTTDRASVNGLAGGLRKRALRDAVRRTARVEALEGRMLLTVTGETALAWSSYLGGSGNDYGGGWSNGGGIAIDASGNAWVTGTTNSAGWANGGFDLTYNGGTDAFVAKINANGTLAWVSYLGGSGDDYGYDIAIDGSGNAWVVGDTSSAGWAAGGFDTTLGGTTDGFVAKINANGTLAWVSHLGGSGYDNAYGVAADGSGNVWVAGETGSSGWTSGGFDTTLDGTTDGFVAKINANGTLAWSGHVGGSDRDVARAIAVDAGGNAWLTGQSYSTDLGSGGFDPTNNGGADALVTKINADGTLAFSSYVGGTGDQSGDAIAIDPAGNAWIVGETWTTDWLDGALGWGSGGSAEIFVAKVNANATLAWQRYYAASSQDSAKDIAFDAGGNAWIAGNTYSMNFNDGGFNNSYGGNYDATLMKISAGGTLAWASPFGANTLERGQGVAVDGAGDVWLVGYTGNFSESPSWARNGFDVTYNGGNNDAWVAKTRPNLSPTAITLSNTTVKENQVVGTLVGVLGGVDPDAGEAFRFFLGGIDSLNFNLVGNKLLTSKVFNYAAKSSYTLDIWLRDAGGAQIVQTFTITVSPLPPMPIVQVGQWNAGFAYDVVTAGNYAYVAGNDTGLRVIDISNPAAPTLVGTYDTAGVAQGVAVLGNYAYVADGAAGLQVIDISNPAAPTRVGGYDTAGTAMAVYAAGQYVYVADGGSGLQIIDVSRPNRPTRAGGYDTWSTAAGVTVSGNYAYVADGSYYGLNVINISNPAAPTLVGTCDTPDFARSVKVVGSYAYIADSYYGMQVIDISTPTAPVLVGTIDTAGYAYAVTIQGEYAYVADYDAGLQVINISNPLAPYRAGGFNTSGYARGVSVSGTQYVVADEGGGLVVLQLQLPVDHPPTDLALSNNIVAENQPAGTVVGTLGATDPSSTDTFTYSLVAGEGSDDNSAFAIVGSELRTAASFSFETRSNYSIRVRVTDSGGSTFDKALAVDVEDVAEVAPVVTELATPQGPFSDGAAISSTSVTLTGTSEPWMLVSAYDGVDAASGTLLGSAYADGMGQWTIALSALAEGSHQFWLEASDSLGNAIVAVNPVSFRVDTTAPPTPVVTINGGAAQRSRVTQVGLVFAEDVTLSAGAVQVKLKNGAVPAGVEVQVGNPSLDGRSYVVTFSGTGVVGGSLADGVYDLVVDASGVLDLAGNVMSGNYTQRFHRLFGDSNGDGRVNLVDYRAMRSTLGKSSGNALFNEALDYDGGGVVNVFDLAQFRKRFGARMVY